MVERNRPFSPKKEEKYKATERMANAKPNENKSWRNLAPQRNGGETILISGKPLQCYECLSTTHLRPNCPQLKRNQPTEQINHVGSAHENELFAPYISEGSVNGSEIKILRDSGGSVDIVTRNYVSNADFTGEVIWVKQPLDLDLRCLPLARVKLNSPEFGEVVTKAAIVDSSLDQGIYLLSNATAELLNKRISIATVNAVTTRSQKKGENAKGDGKAREKTKAPLKLVPVISEIFSKLNIDCVGPLPISEKNNRYLLTAMCMSSKYPDAIPIEDLTSITVINAMLNVFSRMGFPREIQCDWGTSFTSYLTTEFFDKFGIKVTHSSVRHPQTNPVERFHKTIKRLLKVLCLESGKDWEKNLPATLLALRTVTHESTGFSPAELVHGKNLRTPEVLLYEHWVAPKENETAVAKYMYDLINRMRRCQDIAVTRMLETRDKRKLWYDKNAVHRQYKSGDQVLVLAASMPNKLSVQWIGPGEIQSQLSETNYIVKMTGKEAKPQIFHVNLLKPYHKRLAEVNLVFHEEKVNVETENDLEIAYPTGDVNVYDFEEISRSSNLEERLTTEQIGELKELLHKHKTVFSNKPGKTHLVEHDIELISNQPVRSKPYRTSQRQAEILKSEIKQMLDLKIIEMGQSDYTSPMLLVEAPGKAPRPCIDYRKLNSVIKTEYFPLPNLEERVERVSAAKFITVLDLAKGYWQIPMTKNASRLAAFVTNFGTYLPLRMPFGLVNAPYFFSKMMAEILGNCEKYAVPYLDDIAIYSETWEEHLKHVDEVLKRIGAANLTVKPSKCQLAQSRTKYLGHMVGDGVRTPAEAKIKAVIDFPTPKTKTQIRAFLGLAGYYAHYVEKFSVIAAPLTNALKVQTDASDVGMGVVMSQLDSEGKEHPILYLSKKFSDAEKKYSTTEKECASIVYAIKKLKFYLDGQHFTIVTDHNPLVWLKTNAGNNPRLMRWSLALQPYNYTVTHKPGSKHQNADGLSRCDL
ncbi:Retrovirus-related Pol polyprotein like [Argiope bruennichi]|uniref:Retrovirus-related Pol polyprotein like n=1 Tax=Argiope bruennichi TaxID=94029 RepID=A0A8T0EAW4_ARGBR|nr:Retrovirus-related Pol polyprotein like [Argiope bruennichi]